MNTLRAGYIDHDEQGVPIVRQVPPGHILIHRQKNIYFPENSRPGWHGIRLDGPWELINLETVNYKTRKDEILVYGKTPVYYKKREDVTRPAYEEVQKTFASYGAHIDLEDSISKFIETKKKVIEFLEDARKLFLSAQKAKEIKEVEELKQKFQNVLNFIEKSLPISHITNQNLFRGPNKNIFFKEHLRQELDSLTSQLYSINNRINKKELSEEGERLIFKLKIFSRMLQILNAADTIQSYLDPSDKDEYKILKLYFAEYKRNLEIYQSLVVEDVPIVWAVESIEKFGKASVHHSIIQNPYPFVEALLFSSTEKEPKKLLPASSSDLETKLDVKNNLVNISWKTKNGKEVSVVFKVVDTDDRPSYFPEKTFKRYTTSDFGPFFISGLARTNAITIEYFIEISDNGSIEERKTGFPSVTLRPINASFDEGLLLIAYVPESSLTKKLTQETIEQEKAKIEEIKELIQNSPKYFRAIKEHLLMRKGNALAKSVLGSIIERISINGQLSKYNSFEEFIKDGAKSFWGRKYLLPKDEQKLFEQEVDIIDEVYARIPSSLVIALSLLHANEINKTLGVQITSKVSIKEKVGPLSNNTTSPLNQTINDESKLKELLVNISILSVELLNHVNSQMLSLGIGAKDQDKIKEEVKNFLEKSGTLNEFAAYEEMLNAFIENVAKSFLDIRVGMVFENIYKEFLKLFYTALNKKAPKEHIIDGVITQKQMQLNEFEIDNDVSVFYGENPLKTGIGDIVTLLVNKKTKEVVPIIAEVKARKGVIIPQLYSARELSFYLADVLEYLGGNFTIYRPKLYGTGTVYYSKSNITRPYIIDLNKYTKGTLVKEQTLENKPYLEIDHYYHIFSPFSYQGFSAPLPEGVVSL